MVLQEEAMIITDHRVNVSIITTREAMIVKGLQEVVQDLEAATTGDLNQDLQVIQGVPMIHQDLLIIIEVQITHQGHLRVQGVHTIVPDHQEVLILEDHHGDQVAVLQVIVAEVPHHQEVQIVEVLQVPEVQTTTVQDTEDNNW